MTSTKTPALAMRGEAEFEHGGETLKIAFDVSTLMAVEAETGIGFMALQAHWGEARLQASMLRFGLAKGCGVDLPYAQACELWLMNDAAKVAVLEAFNGFLPEPKKAEDGDSENPPAAAQSGAGTNN